MRSYIDILKKLVSFQTINNPIENNYPSKDILDYIESEFLDPFGYKTIQYEKDEYWSLFSYVKRENPTILFLGHCDVVPPGPNWETDPFELVIKEEKAFGRGSADMKGAVSVMLSLAKDFLDESSASIVYGINLDEESGGQAGAGSLLPLLEQKGIVPDFVINGDANGLQIVNRRRNPYVISLTMPKLEKKIKGYKKSKKFETEIAGNRTMHAAYFMRDLDVHCADKASEYLRKNDLRIQKIDGAFVKNNVLPSYISIDYIVPDDESAELHVFDENLTNFFYSVTKFASIDIPSKPSDYGINLTFNFFRDDTTHYLCQMDLRIMNNILEDVENYFKDFITSSSITSELDAKGSIGAVYTPLDSVLVQKSIAVAEKMDLSTEPIEMGGATDSRWFSANNIPAIEFGPLGGNVHGANEFVEIPSLAIVRKFYLSLVNELND